MKDSKFQRLIAWMVFIVAMSIVGTFHACNNITPIKMADRAHCYNGARMTWEPCE